MKALRTAAIGLLLALGARGQTINTVAGGLMPSGPAVSVGIGNPLGVALDSAGNVFISSNGSFVFKVDTAGQLTTFAGTGLSRSLTV